MAIVKLVGPDRHCRANSRTVPPFPEHCLGHYWRYLPVVFFALQAERDIASESLRKRNGVEDYVDNRQ